MREWCGTTIKGEWGTESWPIPSEPKDYLAESRSWATQLHQQGWQDLYGVDYRALVTDRELAEDAYVFTWRRHPPDADATRIWSAFRRKVQRLERGKAGG